MNNSKPFDHILEARAIMARVKASLTLAAVAKEISQMSATPETAERAEIMPEITVVLEIPTHELAPEIHSEPGFGPEPDGVLELPWVEPEIAPPWVGFSELEADGFSAFRQNEAVETPLAVAELIRPETVAVPVLSDEPEPLCELEQEATMEVSSESSTFMRRAGFMALAAAAVIVLMITIGQNIDREVSVASNNHIAIEVDDNSPLVDLMATDELPVVVITDESGGAPTPPTAPIVASNKADFRETISVFLTQLAESGRNFFASTAWAAEVPAMPAQEAEAETAKLEAPAPSDEAVGVYSLEASRNSFTVGETAEVTFTLKKDGKPIDGAGLEIHFEANLHFPNLRTVSRTLDKNGTFTVIGLRPGQSGATSLRLAIGGDAYVEIPVTIAAKPAPPELKTKPMEPPLSERPTPMVIKPNQPLPAAAFVQPNEWTISPGLLRGQLESWSAQAGYQLVWKARNDFEMFSQAAFQGDFTGAVQKLFNGMHSQGSGLLRATIYQGNKVLEVTEE